MLARAAPSAGQPWLFTWASSALVLKLIASYVRYLVAFVFYNGSADAAQYHEWGGKLAGSYRVLDFNADFGFQFIGTGFIRVATGLIYAVTGPSLIGGYLLFSWLGFWGLFSPTSRSRPPSRRGPPALRRYGLLPAVAAVLAVGHRQGSLDDSRPRPLRLRIALLITQLASGPLSWCSAWRPRCGWPHMALVVVEPCSWAYAVRRSRRILAHPRGDGRSPGHRARSWCTSCCGTHRSSTSRT